LSNLGVAKAVETLSFSAAANALAAFMNRPASCPVNSAMASV
jgi:hypothetical protein